MSLNSMIANPTPVKLNDPLEMYGNMLRDQYLSSENRKSAMQANQMATSNAAWQNNPNAFNSNGSPNFNGVMQYQAQHGAGSLNAQLSMDQMKSASDQAQAFMNTQKGTDYQASAVGKTLANAHADLGTISTDPTIGLPQYATKLRAFYQDPNIAGMLQRSGTSAQDMFNNDMSSAVVAAKGGQPLWTQHLASVQDGIAKTYEKTLTPMDTGGTHTIVATDKFGNQSSVVPGSTQVETVSPNHIRSLNNTNVTLNAQNVAPNEFNKGLGAGEVSNFMALQKVAQAAHAQVAEADHISDLVNGGALTGMGSDAKNNLNRLALLIGMKPPIGGQNTTEYTQELNKGLAKMLLDSAGALHAAGISRLTNMDLTILSKATATGNLEPSAINGIVKRYRQSLQDSVNTYRSTRQYYSSQPKIGSDVSEFSQDIPPIPNYAPVGAPVISAGGFSVPKANIDLLNANRSNPAYIAHFDAKYGTGSAEKILGGK